MGGKRKTKRKELFWTNGQQEITVGTIENPYVKGEYIEVAYNIRESSLATMFARKQIDACQYRAGDWFRQKWEIMQASRGAVDPSNEPVDVSGVSEPISTRALMAGFDIAAIKTELKIAWPLVEIICGRGFGLTEAAQIFFKSQSWRQVNKVGKGLRWSLDEIAKYLGYSN